MKIRKIEISNYRIIERATIHVQDLLALVGRNNSGKSSLLNVLNFFFNPSKRYVDESLFTDLETDRCISIFVTFDDLSEWEQENFGPWLDGDRLIVGREIIEAEGDYTINNIARMRVPEPEWLQQETISGAKINEWWPNRDELHVGGCDFGATLGTSKPLVGEWKEKAGAFVAEHMDIIPWKIIEEKNPKGASNVLSGSLPEFIYIPAVRDVSDETKITQSNPFGQLIHAVLDEISDAQKDELDQDLKTFAERLNRTGATERLAEIAAVEERLNELMNELMDCDVEIEMGLPELRKVFGEAKIYADDGIRTLIETKGHGMQRSMIMTILRQYAELASARKAGERADERSTIIAVEEPELYLHPQSQRTLMSVLREIASGRDQVLYSTHSDFFVEVEHFDEVCRIRREFNDGRPRASTTQLTVPMLLADLKARHGIDGNEDGIREQYRNAFGAGVDEGFFADKVVIVEGPSEANLLPPAARSLGVNLDRENVAVVHNDGKGQMDRLFRVFSGFGIPCFLWFDGDKDSENSETKKKTVELMALVEAPIDDLEDIETTVGETFAVMEYDLETMLEEELPSYEELVAGASEEYGPCGKPLRARFIGACLESGQTPTGITLECPGTLQNIVYAIQELDSITSVLHEDALALGPSAPP